MPKILVRTIIVLTCLGLLALGVASVYRMSPEGHQPLTPATQTVQTSVQDCHGPGDCGYADNGLNGDH